MINGRIITTMPAVKQQATLYFLEKGTNQFELSLADDNGVIRSLSGVSGGPGTAGAQTLSEVLTAGNKLEGKEIEGDLVVKNVYTNGVNTTGGYRISGNNEGIELSGSGEGYSSTFKVGGSWSAIRGDFYYPVNTGTSSGYWQLGAKGIELYSEVSDHSLGMQFRATDRELFYNRYVDGKPPLAFTVQDSGIHSQFPDVELGGDNYITFYINSTNGIFLGKYIKPTRDEEYTQKKYVDDLVNSKPPRVSIDRMYINTKGKIVYHITLEGLGAKAADPDLLKYSKLISNTNLGYGSVFEDSYNFKDRHIEVLYTKGDANTGICKVVFEYENIHISQWENTPGDLLGDTTSQFIYIESSTTEEKDYIKSPIVSMSDLYSIGQSGTVNFKSSAIHPPKLQNHYLGSSTEYKLFDIQGPSFNIDPASNSEINNYRYNNGIPLGSQDAEIYFFFRDRQGLAGSIMPNPTPYQTTDWELTLKVGGSQIDHIGIYDFRAVVFDYEDNPIDEAPIFVFNAVSGVEQEVKVRLTTTNTFKNIIGSNKGFKFGMKISEQIAEKDITFEIKSIKRISRSMN